MWIVFSCCTGKFHWLKRRLRGFCTTCSEFPDFFFFLLNKNYPSDVLVNRLHLYSCSRCWQTGFLGFARILINVTIYFSVLFSLIREKILPWCWKKWQKNGLIRLLHIFSLSYVNIWQSFIKNASEELTVFCWPSLGCAA